MVFGQTSSELCWPCRAAVLVRDFHVASARLHFSDNFSLLPRHEIVMIGFLAARGACRSRFFACNTVCHAAHQIKGPVVQCNGRAFSARIANAAPVEIEVLAERREFVVVDKPRGILTHHALQEPSTPDVLTLLSERFGRLHPVGRLDKGVSGVLLLSRPDTEFMQSVQVVQKQYEAFVFGATPAELTISQPLTKKEQHTGHKKVQEAHTTLHTVCSSTCSVVGPISHVIVRITTGRHHQIRKHMRFSGSPIIGDFRHGFKKLNIALQERLGMQLPLCLHSSSLRFRCDGQEYHFSAPLTQQLTEIQRALRISEGKDPA